MSTESTVNKDALRDASQISLGKKGILGLQHAFTMFGATILVPVITGLDISVALFMAGIGTLIFHLLTKGKVPAFLGSSFAFIAPMLATLLLITGEETVDLAMNSPLKEEALAFARGGLVVAGLVYLLLAVLVYLFGAEKVIKFFPPVVTGPIIMVIGLKLAPIAIDMASSGWGLAIAAFLIVTGISVFTKGFIKIVPVIIGLFGAYIIAVLTGNVNFEPLAKVVEEARWFGIPGFSMAKFSLETIMLVAPVAIATMVEHIGDVLAIGSTVEKDFMKEPGLHRTLLGDGIATSISAMFGGPANTTYSENTGVLALTKVWDPLIMRIAAGFAILLSVIPMLSEAIKTIPKSVVGGISIILFGMIAAIGARTLVENKVDFTKSRNLIISAVILVLGLGGAALPIKFGMVDFAIEGMALAAIVGIILNKVLPE